jgi:hypothetical protein
MGSRFSHLHMLFQHPAPAERERTRAERDRESAQLREDLAEGQRLARKQAAQQAVDADPEAFHKAQALKIIQAGARARGLPVPTHLVQDDAPGPGDDQPIDDDKDHKKSKKKAKPKADDDEDAKEKDEDETSDGNDEVEKEKRDKAAALLICNAGRRRRNLPLLSKLD